MSRITSYFTPIGQGCLVLSVSNVDINLFPPFVANKFQNPGMGMGVGTGMGTGMGTGLSSGLGGVGLGGGGMGTGAGIGTGGASLINSENILLLLKS